eukprot:gene7513-9807_t
MEWSQLTSVSFERSNSPLASSQNKQSAPKFGCSDTNQISFNNFKENSLVRSEATAFQVSPTFNTSLYSRVPSLDAPSDIGDSSLFSENISPNTQITAAQNDRHTIWCDASHDSPYLELALHSHDRQMNNTRLNTVDISYRQSDSSQNIDYVETNSRCVKDNTTATLEELNTFTEACCVEDKAFEIPFTPTSFYYNNESNTLPSKNETFHLQGVHATTTTTAVRLDKSSLTCPSDWILLQRDGFDSFESKPHLSIPNEQLVSPQFAPENKIDQTALDVEIKDEIFPDKNKIRAYSLNLNCKDIVKCHANDDVTLEPSPIIPTSTTINNNVSTVTKNAPLNTCAESIKYSFLNGFGKVLTHQQSEPDDNENQEDVMCDKVDAFSVESSLAPENVPIASMTEMQLCSLPLAVFNSKLSILPPDEKRKLRSIRRRVKNRICARKFLKKKKANMEVFKSSHDYLIEANKNLQKKIGGLEKNLYHERLRVQELILENLQLRDYLSNRQ